MEKLFQALVVEKNADGSFNQSVKKLSLNQLPKHEVLIKVHYSSLNYKDALSATGNEGVTKTFPHVPGIDSAGIVERSNDPSFKKGDPVIVTSYDLGQNTFGGFGQYIRVPADWIVPLPDRLTLRESMILGTAGLTAAIGVHHLQHHNTVPNGGTVLVTGATGGVGTMAIAILAKLGYHVTAATGKMDQRKYLTGIGASSVIPREDVQDTSPKPLLSGRWSGAIETVGGSMLDTVLRQAGQNGTVACCGNVLGHELHTNVYPFILRGVSLMGIDSGNCAMNLRKTLWNNLSSEWKPKDLSALAKEISLQELSYEIEKMLKGKQIGRIVVNLTN